MTTQEIKRKLTAILSADVKGYSRLMGEDEAETIRTLNVYKEVITSLIRQHHGRVVDEPGDNLLAEFNSVVDAVECSVEIQKELKARNADLPENRKMEFRIGVNLGDVVEGGEKIFGDGVNIAARLESLSQAGGVCISGTAFDQVRNKLELGYEYLGEQTVKNIAIPVRVYKVLMEPGAVGKVIGEKKVRPKLWQRAALVVAAILVVVVAAFAIWRLYLRPTAPIEVASKEKMAFPLPDKPSIAVLPFTNMSGDPKEEYFCDGITDQIITTLSMIPRLFVIARNSTFVYKGKAIKVNKVAEEMGVRYVLEGSVQRSKDRVRILVQLIDAIKGIHLWSERYDRDLKDIFVLQDEIARQIMTALQVKLTEGEFASGVAGSTSNLRALECFWRAEEHFFRLVKEDNAAARQWAQKAVELDPKFAGAWALMGWTYLFDVNFGWSKSPFQSMGGASECAQKAINLNDSCAKTYALMGNINLHQRKFDEAIENGEKAVGINPNDPMMLTILGTIMHFNGRFDESIAVIKNAMRLSPYYPALFLRPLSMSYFLAGRYEEALAASKLMLARANKGEFSPLLAHISLAEAYIGLGQDQKARVHVEEILKMNPNFSLADERKRFGFYRDPIHLERHIDALRKAGLPEKSSASIPPSAEVVPEENIPVPKSEKVSKPVTPPPPKEDNASKEKMAFPLPDVPSIAVLPFTNMSGEKEVEYFGDGLAEGIINGLSKSEHIFVIARNSTFIYKGKPVKVKQVAEETGVRYVIEGSVQQEKNRVRITVQLIDAMTGRHLFSERYDRDLKDILTLQDEITMKVLTAVQVKLTGGEDARLRAKGTKNCDAYLKLLQAREHYQIMSIEKQSLARQSAEEAIALDPQYSAAYALLAIIPYNETFLGVYKNPRQALERAVEVAKKAVALDDSNSHAHAALSFLYVALREHEKGFLEAEKAVSFEPNSAWAHHALGSALTFADRFEEALPFLKKSLRLSPIAVNCNVLVILGNVYRDLGQHEEAVATFKKSLQLCGPDHLMSHLALSITYVFMGLEKEARAEASEVMRINPNFSVERYIESVPVINQSRKKRGADALRKAGLK